MNKIIKNTLILAAITVVSGLVLGAAYEVTKDPIAQTQAKQKQEACQAVYPEADSFEAMDVDQKAAKEAIKKMGTNATVDEVYSAVMDGSEAGYVITVTDKDGYGGDIQITVGIMVRSMVFLSFPSARQQVLVCVRKNRTSIISLQDSRLKNSMYPKMAETDSRSML